MSHATEIGVYDVADISFYVNPNGFLCLNHKGEDQKRVTLVRTLPVKDPNKYISVMNLENKELGILEDITTLDPEQQKMLDRELAHRYYCPTVTEIFSIKEKMGYLYIEASISGTKKTFAIKDVSRNLRVLDANNIIITDIDGNRYYIPDLFKIPTVSRRKLEPYLY